MTLVVYAEISVAFGRIETLEATLPEHSAAKTSRGKRRFWPASASSTTAAGAASDSPLPDFYIGAHAAVSGRALLTRDADRYRTLLPTLTLISP